MLSRDTVAPHAGAWIETEGMLPSIFSCCMSHPTRVRGLKLRLCNKIDQFVVSHPTRVRGLKQFYVA